MPTDTELANNPLILATTVSDVQRDELGRLLPGSQLPLTPAKRVRSWMTKQLEGVDPADPDGRARLEKMFNAMYTIVTCGSPTHYKEAVWAFNALVEQSIGKAPLSDEDRQALMDGRVQVIVLPASATQLRQRVHRTPEFADAEVIEVNE